MRIKRLVEDHRTHCLVVDPVSGLSKAGNHLTAHGVSERLLDWAKAQGITLLCTSLVEPGALEAQALSIPISTIADTWIHLSYVIRAGERNRCLSIVKSRGTWHSNQVRELLLGSQGVTLTDVYTAGGEVLMGTLRWEKERSERIARSEQAQRAGQQLAQLDLEESELAVRLKGIELQLAAKRLAREGLAASAVVSAREDTLNRRRLRELRGVEAPSRATR
jgi:circadian clock protein KaiC